MAGAAVRNILGDSRSAKRCIFSIENASPGWDESGLRSGGCEMTILSSDVVESSFYWRKHFRHFHLKSTPKNFVAGAVFGEVGR